jgi:ABC-type amino acid transport substrate-binding protein
MKRILSGLAVLLAIGTVTHAQQPAAPAGKKINIALYAPNAPFASGAARFDFIQRLAQQISSVAGVTAEGKAFARYADFEAAIKSKQVDFAVVDGVYLAEKGAPWPVLAIGTTGGQTKPKWGLFSNTATDVQSLQGKKLAVATSGARDDDFIGNALCGGELQVKKWFASKVSSPDIASAVQAVTLHKAEAVFAPESEAKGMKKIFDAGEVPNAAFVEVASGLPNDLVSKVKSAVISHGVAAALDGWRAGDAGPYRVLAGAMSSRSKKPVMAEPDPVKMEDLDILVPPTIETALPDLKTQYWNPAP